MFQRLSWLKQRCIVAFRFIFARLSQWATPISQLESKCMLFFSNLYCCHFSSFFSVKQSRWNLWSVWGFVLWGRQCSTGQETEIDEIDWWVWLQLQLRLQVLLSQILRFQRYATPHWRWTLETFTLALIPNDILVTSTRVKINHCWV